MAGYLTTNKCTVSRARVSGHCNMQISKIRLLKSSYAGKKSHDRSRIFSTNLRSELKLENRYPVAVATATIARSSEEYKINT